MEIYSLSCKKFNSFVSTMNLLYSAVRLKSQQRTKFMDCIYLAVLSLLHHGIIYVVITLKPSKRPGHTIAMA